LMKILSINAGIPDSVTSNLLISNVFQDYSAVIVDPSNVETLYGDLDYYDGPTNKRERIIKHDLALALVKMNIKRRNEVEALLRLGGVLVCFLRPIIRRLYSSLPELFESITNYDWFPEQLVSEIHNIQFSKGNTIDYLDSEHPFFNYLKTKPSWSAYVDINQCKSSKILASAFGSHVLSFTKRVDSGHMVFIPSAYSHANGELLKECIVKLLKNKEILPQPNWARKIFIPGQEDLKKEIKDFNSRINSLEKGR
ncbi:unnamed protein product, partial [marine sediment metagenome]